MYFWPLPVERLASHEQPVPLGVPQLLHLVELCEGVEGAVRPVALPVENRGRTQGDVIPGLHSDELDALDVSSVVGPRRPAGREGSAALNRVVGMILLGLVGGLGRQRPARRAG